MRLYDLVASSEAPPPSVVINELLYENYHGFDNDEFVELHNVTGGAINIGGWTVTAVSGSGNVYELITVPPNTVLAADGYYVIGNASVLQPVYGNVVDYNAGWMNSLRRGAGSSRAQKQHWRAY